MLASEIRPTRSYHNGRGVAYGVEAIQSGSVYFRTNGLKEGLLASMDLKEFAKVMTAEASREERE